MSIKKSQTGMKIFVTYKALFTNISKMNLELFQKMAYTLNSVQNTTTYQRDNLKELYVNLKVRAAMLLIMKLVMFQS